jgi:quercetin dioxygenase-like cupin family protein
MSLEAHGRWWLLSIETSRTDNHHNGSHVVEVALPALPPAPKYSFLAMSAYIPHGMTSRVHHHSGVETFYTVDGEQCLETPTRAYRLPKGATLAIPPGVPMRLVANGSVPRRALAAIIYDASQPPTTRMDMENTKHLVACEQAKPK